jgi:hypothetical protein
MDFGTSVVIASTKMDAGSPKAPLPTRLLKYIRKIIKDMQLRQVMKSYGLHNMIGFV